jgi:hypothetical protein
MAKKDPKPTEGADASGNPKKRKNGDRDGEGGKKQKGGDGGAVPAMVVKKEFKQEVVVNANSRTSSTTLSQITQVRTPSPQECSYMNASTFVLLARPRTAGEADRSVD